MSHPTGRSSGLKYASVCDGIGAAHVAWQPLGWQCQWTSEIEPFPAAVVEHHYGFRNLGDMTAITEEMLDAPVDLLVGGTPCQSFSVAGLRGGLADPRGNLALRFVQLASVMQPRWIVWENVPGVLSSGKGRDFGTFLGALGELGYGFAYRVLDAQWFGVAQRRRRVFVVGHLGDWRRAAAVLFERESVFGNPPTRGAKGQGITSSPEGIAGNVSSKWAKGTGGPAGDECYNLVAEPQAIAFGGQMSTPQVDVELSQKLQRKNPQAVATTFDWQAGGGGNDTSFRGKSRSYIVDKPECARALTSCKTLAVATPIDLRQASRGEKVTNNRTSGSGGPPGHGVGDGGDPAFTVSERGQAVAFTAKDCGGDASQDVAPTMRAMGHSGSHANGGGQLAVAFTKSKRAQSTTDDETWVPGEVSPTMSCFDQGDTRATTVVALQDCGGRDKRQNGRGWNGDGTAYTVDAAATQGVGIDFQNVANTGDVCGTIMGEAQKKGGEAGHGVMTAMAVRRLTPRECERLQGFPDDYTLVTYRNKPAADGPRYRALGNSMAVPVMRWIGERIAMVDRIECP